MFDIFSHHNQNKVKSILLGTFVTDFFFFENKVWLIITADDP